MGRFACLVEVRHRLARSLSDASQKTSPKFSSFKDSAKLANLNQERSIVSKLRWFKYLIILAVFVTLVKVLHSPIKNHYTKSSSPLVRSNLSGWMWNQATPDPRYASNSNINWAEIQQSITRMNNKEKLNIGLLNFNTCEIKNWQKQFPTAKISKIELEKAEKNLSWDDLYPEWIDEEEESEVPSCRKLPTPKIPQKSNFDLVAVKLPCNKTGNWTRDIARLHLQLATAKIASDSDGSVHVLVVTDCLPIPNLFSCKNLVVRKGNVWLFKPDLHVLKQKLELPIGSCELSLSLKQTVRPPSTNPKREAYATILHSVDLYVCGAITAAQSIRLSGSTRDLVILVDDTLTHRHKSALQSAGWKIKTIKRIRNPRAEKNAYNEFNYSKFRLWQLTQYDKIIFIDADLLILRNIDFLFNMPEISASGNNGSLFNSGVMVIEPSVCTFKFLMENVGEIISYNGGDQGYLNEVFTWWHRIPRRMNFLKHFWVGDEVAVKERKNLLFGAEPPVLYLIHYLGVKPWLCFRDYDCNWNVDFMQEFASDVAHERWWKVYDLMEKKLQKFCLLSTHRKAGLEWDRRRAQRENYADGHWGWNVSDPRREICRGSYCDWESMLVHWKDPRYVNRSSVVKKTERKLTGF